MYILSMQFKSLEDLPQIKSIEMNDYARKTVIHKVQDRARFEDLTMLQNYALIDD
jgi:hypothetical protein